MLSIGGIFYIMVISLLTDTNMNNIPKNQNKQENIIKLSAQRNLYSQAKQIQLIQIILNIPIVIVLSILTLWNKSFETVTIMYGVFVSLLDICVLNQIQQNKKEKAAKIQELFDCDVLELEWNDLKCGNKPTLEDIYEYQENQKVLSKLSPLKDWYSTSVGEVPISIARILCQLENCTWDSKLRKNYRILLILTTSFLFFLILILGIINNLTICKFFLLVVSPTLPSIIFCIRESNEHKETILVTERIKKNIDNIVNKTRKENVSANYLLEHSRKLQDEIFERRKRSPLIFNKIYLWLRKPYENKMDNWLRSVVDNIKTIYQSN